MRPLCRALPVLLVLLAPLARAQGITSDTPLRPVTRTFALTNARVVQAPGRVLEGATVVVRDGLIAAVGRAVAVPYDAEVIEADSLTVYAGFVDALGHAGVPEPPEEEDPPPVPDPGAPPRDRAGLQPDRDVRALLRPDHSSVEAFRNAGFTAAHVVPYGGMLPGQGAVVLLRAPSRGERPEAVLLTGPVSLYASFRGAEGVYPTTPMGVTAVLRDLLTEAARRRAPSRDAGAARAPYDPVLEALAPALARERPLFFEVRTPTAAFRALALSDELRVPVVLAGLPWSVPLVEALRGADEPVLAPLALPDTLAADTSATAVPYPPPAPGEPVFIAERRARSYDDVPTEQSAMHAQRAAAVGRYEANAATLAAAGVPFAFTTLGAKPEQVRPNLRRMVAAGLSEDDALAALTTTPARLLGLDGALGTVEEGRLANLVVTAGGYFEEDAEVRFVFVEGVRYEVDEDRPEGADPDAVVDAAGTWRYTASTPDGEQTGTFTLEGTGASLRGTIRTDEVHILQSITLEGNVLTLRYLQPGLGEVRLTGVIEGDTFTGSAEAPGVGTFSVTAIRQPE
jgi:imidazolonepropionase-like amidohydrolase